MFCEADGRCFPCRRIASCYHDAACRVSVVVLVFAVLAGVLPPRLFALQSGTTVAPRTTQSGTPANASPDEASSVKGRGSRGDAADPNAAEPRFSDAGVNDGISDGAADPESESTSQVTPADLAQLLPSLDWMEDGVDTDLDALFRQRIRLYGRCLQHWVQRHVDLQPWQQTLLAAELDQIADRLVPMRSQLQSWMGRPYTPILFMQRVAPHVDTVLSPNNLPALELSDLQREKLATALQVRQWRLKQDILEGVLFRVDTELLLTPRQSDLLAQVSADAFDLADPGFSFLIESPILGFKAINYSKQGLGQLLRHERLYGSLSSHQRNLLADLVSQDRDFPVKMDALRKGEPGLLQPQADYNFRVQKSIVGALVDRLKDEVAVDEQTALQVQMTAAGLVDRSLAEWQRNERRDCLKYAGKDSVVTTPGHPSRTFVFESAEFTAALGTIAGGWQVRRQRDARLRLQLTHYMRGLLDQELWLTSSQREALCTPLSASVQQGWLAPSPNYDVVDDWAWGCMAVSLHSVPDRQLPALSRDQRLALIGLRRLLTRDDRGFQVSQVENQSELPLLSRFSLPQEEGR